MPPYVEHPLRPCGCGSGVVGHAVRVEDGRDVDDLDENSERSTTDRGP